MNTRDLSMRCRRVGIWSLGGTTRCNERRWDRSRCSKSVEDASENLGQAPQVVGSAASNPASYRHLSQGCDHHGDRGDEFLNLPPPCVRITPLPVSTTRHLNTVATEQQSESVHSLGGVVGEG